MKDSELYYQSKLDERTKEFQEKQLKKGEVIQPKKKRPTDKSTDYYNERGVPYEG